MTRTIPAVTLAVLAAGCSAPVADGPPYTAEVLALSGWDAETELGSYELAPRELVRLDDLESLSGPWFRMFRGGALVISDGAGSVVNDGRFTERGAPALRYVVDDGVVRARDYPTLAMLSSWYQFEQVFEAIERVTGEPTDDLIADTGRFEIYFEPVVKVEGEGELTATMKFNAFYLPGTHQFGLARRSRDESVPLAASHMVIAHEFGHALFERTFFAGEAPTCDEDDLSVDGRLTVEYAISGLNEGFADFVSFAMVGTTNPLGDLEIEERSLTRRDFVYADLTASADGGDGEPVCVGRFYCIGTLFARSLYDAFEALGGEVDDAEQRGGFAREVVAAMAATRAAMVDLPEAEGAVRECERAEDLDPTYDGAVTGAFLAAFAGELTPATRPAFCAAAIDQFGDVGFPPAQRAACEVVP